MDATRFVEELISLGVASREQIDAAARATSAWRTLPGRLLELGCDRGDLLAAVSAAIGLPPAPPSVLRTTAYAPDTSLPVESWRALLACPLAGPDGIVLLTTTLEAVTAAQAAGVTPVRVFVALEQDIEDMLRRAEGAPPVYAYFPQGPAATSSFQAPPSTSPSQEAPGSATSALSDFGVDDSLLDRAPTSGERLCGYEVFEELGRGASAVVFRARRPGESYDVALKVITRETARDPAFPQRFKREIRAQASLTHPNIVHVVDYGREEGWYFLATEYLPGGTLEDFVERHGPLPGVVATLMLHEVLQGIAFAQTRGIVHRDLKPGNLLLAADGRIKIGDFGLARMDLDPNKSSFGAVQGTPAYMSPEQALGLDLDGRSDLFTLATIVYEAVTGTNPYRRDIGPASLMAVAQARGLHLFDAAPEAPLELDDVVSRMSHKEPERRPASAEEVLSLLAPAVERISRRWPGLLARYLRAPEETRRELAAELANDELARAQAALEALDEKLRPRAALSVIRALRHDPSSSVAQALWASLSSTFRRGPAEGAELIALEKQMADAPEDPRHLRRASELARAEGNVWKQAAYLRRYLRVGQKDTLAQHQLALLLGDQESAPSASEGRLHTPPTSPAAPVATLSSSTTPTATPTTTPAVSSTQPASTTTAPIPSARAPRVVGTGTNIPMRTSAPPGRALASVLVVLLVGAVIGALWFFREELRALLSDKAAEHVEERVQDAKARAEGGVGNPGE